MTLLIGAIGGYNRTSIRKKNLTHSSVLSCVVSGGFPDILLTTDSLCSCLVFYSIVTGFPYTQFQNMIKIPDAAAGTEGRTLLTTPWRRTQIDSSSFRRVPVAWSVEFLPSNRAWVRFPAVSEILISILELGVYSLSVFSPVLSLAVALTL